MKALLNLFKLIAFGVAIVNFFYDFQTWILSVIVIGLLFEELVNKFWKQPFFKNLYNK